MMTEQQALRIVKTKPFSPYRIRLTNDKSIDVHRPEMVEVARGDVLLVFRYSTEEPDIVEHWETVSLMLIDSIEPLNEVVRPQGT